MSTELEGSSYQLLDPEALERTLGAFALVQHTIPAPSMEDTVSDLLVRVGIAFHEFVSDILCSLDRPGLSGSPVTAAMAGRFVRRVADLLAVLSIQANDDTPEARSAPRLLALSRRWMGTISEICIGTEGFAWYRTEAACVEIIASTLATAARTLRDRPCVALDPDDPRIRSDMVRDFTTEETPEDAAIALVWAAAGALCTAAGIRPDFRPDSHPEE
jgi:hypothetical protein